jgi:RING finger/CHY zinc finger protein 1
MSILRFDKVKRLYTKTALITYHHIGNNQPILGCEHYASNAAIVAPCCNDVYTCRLCHDERNEHKIDRSTIKHMVCLICASYDKITIQPISSHCKDCKTRIAIYFCKICNFFDNDSTHNNYHCEKCKFCRNGKSNEYIHCASCDCCYNIDIYNSHVCEENCTDSICPICLDDLQATIYEVYKPSCGHLVHTKCAKVDKERNAKCYLCNELLLPKV